MVKIIAEMGFNHEGRIRNALKMIREAAASGVDAVKFQTYRAYDIALPSSPHYELIKKGEMGLKEHRKLARVASDCGVEFLSTPFSAWAVEILEKIKVPAYKVASMDCTNKHLLGLIAKTGKPIYLSTGMATLTEISETIKFLSKVGSGSVTLMHCVSIYPPQTKDLNLNLIPFLRESFDLPVGYSDHHAGTDACLAAAALGAKVIEKHFTLDRSKRGGDHSHSADPKMIKKLVRKIRVFEEMIGAKDAMEDRPDRRFAALFRRGIYAARNLKEGHVIRERDLLLCRPASLLKPEDVVWLKGRTLIKNVAAYKDVTRETVRG